MMTQPATVPVQEPSEAPVPAQAPEAPLTIQPGAIPLTREDVLAIRASRSELSSQLTSAEGRRERLARSLEGKSGADRAGIEQRLEVLDVRIAQLEADIAETGRQLTSAPGTLLSSSTGSPITRFENMSDDSIIAISSVFMIFVMTPIAIAFARRIWKRTPAALTPKAAAESAQRLERMEQALDSIAIEVERISEGQRFVTRVMAETRGRQAIGVGQPAAEQHERDRDAAARLERERR